MEIDNISQRRPTRRRNALGMKTLSVLACWHFLSMSAVLAFVIPSTHHPPTTSDSSSSFLLLHARQEQQSAVAVVSMDSCLAVVPPDKAWDRLQRARHVARDKSYTKWPPCIRLLHPFLADDDDNDVALKIADIVESHQIEPFVVKLNQWSLVPHVEAMEADWEAMRSIGATQHYSSPEGEMDEEAQRIQDLIAREERIGRRNFRERQRREGVQQPQTKTPEKPAKESRDGALLLEKQKRMYEEFNGPTVLILEPDAESAQKLRQLRDLLLEQLGLEESLSPYSISSSVSNELISSSSSSSTEFRPAVPIAAFPTVTSAMEMARKLRQVWQRPLSFPVTDLHLMSSSSSSTAANNKNHMSWLSQDDERHLSAAGQFGCNAMVMLRGEEEPQDAQLNQEMTNFVLERGETGGGDTAAAAADHKHNHVAAEISQDDTAELGVLGDLEHFLEEDDDDYDQGTVVVIGRTHFFTGEARDYVGMPAFSVNDGKDRVGVSGAARRRGVIHRSSARLNEQGNWGRNSDDFLPRTSKEIARQKKRLENQVLSSARTQRTKPGTDNLRR